MFEQQSRQREDVQSSFQKLLTDHVTLMAELHDAYSEPDTRVAVYHHGKIRDTSESRVPANRFGFVVTDHYDTSGHRHQLRELLTRIRESRDIDLVITYEVYHSRLQTSAAEELLQTIEYYVPVIRADINTLRASQYVTAPAI
ncbi:hypothetical protein JOF53_005488 [Crossiella equi]|uniref:Uncharacterized protein n=1 Tax=Crossiella equi TaxID=130796 RepID=A0ABS5AJP9_9PSEU|nr:hypothetical protein [Crossiella equi]MBP2476616.1 hypothetical protein [Crossiella equi]